MKITLKTEKYKILKLFLVSYLLLSYAYFKIISTFWYWNKIAILKNEKFSFDFGRYLVVSIAIILCVFTICYINQKKFIFSIQAIVLLLFVIPSGITFSSYKIIEPSVFIGHLLFLVTLILFSRIKIIIPIKKLTIKHSYHSLFILALIGMIPFLKYWYLVNLNNLLLIDIYKTRDLFSNVGNLYTAYTYSWFSIIIIPALIVFSIFYKNRIVLLLSIAMLIFLFLFGAQKSVFFGLTIVLIFYYKDYLQKIKYVLVGTLSIVVLGIISSLLLNSDLILIYTIRRVFMLPSLLDFVYFDFFNENYLYWSEVVGDIFKTYPYSENHSRIIGEVYFNSSEISANNGIISDGYMNFGMLGVFLNILVVSAFYSAINHLNISNKFFGLYFLFTIAILSSSLSTVLLTHGGIILLFISIIFLKDSKFVMENYKI
tara:strand:+ start:1561 stop:2847 length:1287 start_codon:yes stop_codon:yes gene_type:complete